jgi:hypothetical protein
MSIITGKETEPARAMAAEERVEMRGCLRELTAQPQEGRHNNGYEAAEEAKRV